MATRSLFVALAAVAALAAAPGAASAQPINPGAMKTNGNFFTFTECKAGSIRSAEWDEASQTWVLGAYFPRKPVSSPAGPTISGGFVVTVTNGSAGKESLERWDPLSPETTTNLGSPTSGHLSDPTVRGSYAYVVAETGSGSGNMYRCNVATGTWTDLGVPVGEVFYTDTGGLGRPYYSAPCVGITYRRAPGTGAGSFLDPGPSLFAIGSSSTWPGGNVYEKNVGVFSFPLISLSKWIDRGNPGWLVGGGGGAMTISAPMPGKLFATSALDGGLYELGYGSYGWFNHGTPAPGYDIEVTPAVATQDGEAYVVARDQSSGLREVFQLRWSSGWKWKNLGSPPTDSIQQYAWPVAAYSTLGLAQRIVVRGYGGSDNYWMLWYDAGTWKWKNLGAPPSGPGC